MATLEEEYQKYKGEDVDAVNSMYDAQKQSQLAGMESAYNKSLSDAQAAKDAIPGQYQQRANDLSAQYERQRRNLNQQAAANGLNTGAGSQMQLSLGGNYNRDYAGIRTAQQQALDAADRGIRDLQSAYQSSVQQAVANNDYQRAQALLAEYKNQYQRQLQQAQTMASYGNFSGYLGVPGYSQEQVDTMRNTWIASNPQLAYNTGALSAEGFYRMTGKWPAGYQSQTGTAQAGGAAVYPGSEQPSGAPAVAATGDESAKTAADLANERGERMTEYYQNNPQAGGVGAGVSWLVGAARDLANRSNAEMFLQQQIASGAISQQEADEIRRGNRK